MISINKKYQAPIELWRATIGAKHEHGEVNPMLNSNCSTKDKQVNIPIQRSMFGPDKYFADTRQKLANLYYKNPEVFKKEKQVILEYWRTYEGLDEVLKDRLPVFIEWFKTNTSPETITRSLRSLKEDGTIQLSSAKIQERQENEQKYRQFWGDEARQRYNR